MLSADTRRCSMRAAVACLALVAGCVTRAPPLPEPRPAAPPAPAAGSVRFLIDDAELVLRVYRDGPLKQFGHNHVIASRSLTGWAEVAAGGRTARFQVELPVESLVVDEPARRAEAGDDFPGEVPQADRDGTRRNMLGPALLDAATSPLLAVSGELEWPPAPAATRRLTITVRGQAHEVEVPVTASLRNGTIEVLSNFTVTHAALGLTPFSVAMGAVRVREDIGVHVRLHARVSGAT